MRQYWTYNGIDFFIRQNNILVRRCKETHEERDIWKSSFFNHPTAPAVELIAAIKLAHRKLNNSRDRRCY